MKELIREVDTEEEERNCTSSKFKDQAHLVDKKARISIEKAQFSASSIR